MEPNALPARHVSVNPPSPELEAKRSTVPGAFELFFRDQHPRAVRLAWFLTRSQTAAEDITQEAMLATHARFETLNEPAAFLTRVIVNKCHSWTRQTIVRRTTLEALPHPNDATEHGSDVELLDAVQRLPYRQQVVIITRYWGGWSEREIAAALDCRPGTVKSLASRALDQLKKELDR